MLVPTRLQPFLIAVAACLGLGAFAAYDLVRERQLEIRAARANTANLVHLLEEELRQSLRRVETSLTLGVAAIQRSGAAAPPPPGDEGLRQQLQAAKPIDGLVRGLEWFDAQGRIVVSTVTPRPGESVLAEHPERRDWFTALAAPSITAPSITAPPINSPSVTIGRLEKDREGRPVLPVAMRVGAAADGAFRGVLVALVDPAAMQPVFEALDTGSNGFVTLFHRHGWLLLTAPVNPALSERNWSNTPMFSEHLPRSATGTVEQVVVRDGTERVYSYRALADFPLVVSIGISLTDALAEWRDRLRGKLILLLAMFAMLLFSAWLMTRHHQRREAAERALAEAAGQTQAIVDHVADAIVSFDPQGRIESINLAGEAIFGVRAADCVGRPLADLVSTWPPPIASADDSQRRAEAQGRRADGSLFPIEIALTQGPRAGAPLQIALIRDITERQRAQAVLAEARERAETSELFLRQITDNVPLRIAYVDHELRYRFVNQAHCLRFGLPRERIIGRTREELTGAPAAPEVLAELQRVLAGERLRYEFSETLGQRSTVIESHLVPDLDAAGKVRGFYSASADITERKQQQRRVELALAERETLLREVYHRVKNNLQVIQSLLSLQKRALPEGPARDALNDSVQRIRAMALVHEKLYQTGTLSAVQLADYTRELLVQIGEAVGAARRAISFVVEVDPIEAPLDLALPFGLLVAELVTNSLKHGFPLGRGGEIRVRLTRCGAHLRLQVCDTGVSLPPEFDLQQTRSMGLQLAASLAGQLGGNLQAHNEVGAVFTTDLPRLG